MLLNILHTIAITCAIGTNIYSGNMKRTLPKRESAVITHYEENMQIQASDYELIQSDRRTQTFTSITYNYKARRQFQNQYFTADIIVANTINSVSGNNTVVSLGKPILEHLSGTSFTSDRVLQKMIAVKITPTGYNKNTEITINELLFNQVETSGNRYGIFSMLFTNRSERMEALYSNSTETITLWSNYENYEAYMNMIYSFGGYTGILQYDFDYLEDQNGYGKYEKNREIQVLGNKDNYYVFYEESRLVYENANTNSTLQTLGINTQQNNAINIKFEADNVITSSTNTEIVDLPGTMFTVLGMPFTFISQAFNLTLFPGTPYEVDLSLLFLGILAVAIFIFVVRIVIGFFNRG